MIAFDCLNKKSRDHGKIKSHLKQHLMDFHQSQ